MPAFSLERSTVIGAPVEEVFAKVVDFHQWGKWSPWLCTEVNARVEVSQDGKSVGSIYKWDGKLVGNGEIEHKQIQKDGLILQEIRFKKPFKSTGTVSFAFLPQENGTKVIWTMDGSLPFFLFFMKKMMVGMIGADYERGLLMLKNLVETGKVEFQMDYKDTVQTPEVLYLGTSRKVSFDDIEASMKEAFSELERTLEEKGIRPIGVPFSLYHSYDFHKRETEFTVGMPVPPGTAIEKEGFFVKTRPDCRALKVLHTGDYQYLGNSWVGGYQYVFKTKGLKMNKAVPAFEEYVNDPRKNPPEQWKTEIFIPVKS